jgi:hypothetical protein
MTVSSGIQRKVRQSSASRGRGPSCGAYSTGCPSKTRGASRDTVDGMSRLKIERLVDELRHERFRWTPVRRVHIPKKNGKLRALDLGNTLIVHAVAAPGAAATICRVNRDDCRYGRQSVILIRRRVLTDRPWGPGSPAPMSPPNPCRAGGARWALAPPVEATSHGC